MEKTIERIIALVIVAIMVFSMAAMVTGCGKKWTCDWCDKTWTGDAYYGREYSDVLCDECAQRYWNPLPFKNYKK